MAYGAVARNFVAVVLLVVCYRAYFLRVWLHQNTVRTYTSSLVVV